MRREIERREEKIDNMSRKERREEINKKRKH